MKNKTAILAAMCIVMTVLFIAVAVCFLFSKLSSMVLEDVAINNARLAGVLWAENYYDTGRIVKLRLRLEPEPKPAVEKPTEFDGPYVILDYPAVGDPDSPTFKIGRTMVDAFNERMATIVQDPKQHQADRAEAIEYWRSNVLKKERRAGKDGERAVRHRVAVLAVHGFGHRERRVAGGRARWRKRQIPIRHEPDRLPSPARPFIRP